MIFLFFLLEDSDFGKLSSSPGWKSSGCSVFPHRVSTPAPNCLGDPPLNLLRWKTCFPCHEAQILRHSSSYGHRRVKTKTKIFPFESTDHVLINITQDAVGILSSQGTLLSCSVCCLPQRTGIFSRVLCYQTLLLPGSLPTQLRTLHWPLLSFTGFLLAHSSSLSVSPWQPCPQLYWLLVLDNNDWHWGVICKPMRLLSAIEWSSLINILKRTCIRTDTCSVSLVTGLQVQNLTHLWLFSKFFF